MRVRLKDYAYKLKRTLRVKWGWLTWVYILVLIFVSSGSVSGIIEGSRWGPGVLIIRSRMAETGLEALIFGVSSALGIAGAFLIYRGVGVSSKRVSNMYILGGLALLAVGMAISGWLTYLKT